MCRYHAVPAKGPSKPLVGTTPRKAELQLRQGQASPLYPQLHFQPRKGRRVNETLCFRNLIDDAQTMKAPPATANPANTHQGIDASNFIDLSFLQEEDDEEDREGEWGDDCGSDTECSTPQHPILFPQEQLSQILEGVCSCRTQLEVTLLRDVREALWIATERVGLSAHNEGHRNSNLRRFVMNNLRCVGYNAGICKSRWEETNGYPAGDYEFIDVIEGAKSNDRLLVDIDFKAQFEIARPTAEYVALVQVLPTLLVGRVDKLRDIIWIMCDAAKRSLKARGMHLPPWRKKRYIEAKWLGPQKRSTSPLRERHEQHLLLRQFAGIGSFQGMEWNACFLLQMELHFEKAVREANKDAREKLKSQRQEHPSTALLSFHNNLKSRVSGKGETPAGRISGLGKALAQAVNRNNISNVY